MKVGELIDMLEPYRGRGEDVIVEDSIEYIEDIVSVYWDDVAKVVVIRTKEPRGYETS